MSIRKHPQSGIWWVDITPPGGKRIRRSTGTRSRQQAQEYHDRLRVELWRVHQLGEQPKRLFEEARVLFLKASAGQRDYATKVRHVKYWREIFAGRTICSLTREEVFAGLPSHRTYSDRPARALAPATRNRYLASIRRILSLAVEAGWLNRAPKLTAAKEPDVRVRWLTHDKATQLLRAITAPWLKDACRFALATGCRSNEIFSLTWAQVDEKRCLAWITSDLAKSGKARAVPLNEDALDVIQARRGSHESLVFSRKPGGAKIQQIDRRVFNKALQAVGIEDFTFYDLRHTWASWHVQAGTPLFILKELGGWEKLEMVKKYAHLDAGHLLEHVNAVTFRSQQEQQKKRAAG